MSFTISQKSISTSTIFFSHHSGFLGITTIGSVEDQICYVSFDNDEPDALNALRAQFPNAKLQLKRTLIHTSVLYHITNNSPLEKPISLIVDSTGFQEKIWRRLLDIPYGHTLTYGDIAKNSGNPQASRAVGNAIGKNPIAYLIPCHRVVTKNNKPTHFRWGPERKVKLLQREQNLLF